MTGRLFGSVATFRRCFWHKASFILLNQFDLMLTLVALLFGFYEINPIMRNLLINPFPVVLFKVFIPIAIAWLVPGKLLLPAIALLAFIVGWDLKELIFYFI